MWTNSTLRYSLISTHCPVKMWIAHCFPRTRVYCFWQPYIYMSSSEIKYSVIQLLLLRIIIISHLKYKTWYSEFYIYSLSSIWNRFIMWQIPGDFKHHSQLGSGKGLQSYCKWWEIPPKIWHYLKWKNNIDIIKFSLLLLCKKNKWSGSKLQIDNQLCYF